MLMGTGQTLQSCSNRCEKLQICCTVSMADGSSEEKVKSNVVTVSVISSEFSWRARCCTHGQALLLASAMCVCVFVCASAYVCALDWAVEMCQNKEQGQYQTTITKKKVMDKNERSGTKNRLSYS